MGQRASLRAGLSEIGVTHRALSFCFDAISNRLRARTSAEIALGGARFDGERLRRGDVVDGPAGDLCADRQALIRVIDQMQLRGPVTVPRSAPNQNRAPTG